MPIVRPPSPEPTQLRYSFRRGSLLIVTLWLIAVLSMLSIAISSRLSMELRLVKYQIAQARARALARGAVRYALELLKSDQEDAAAPYDWLGEEWAYDRNADRNRPPGESVDPTVLTLELFEQPAGTQPASPSATIQLRITDEERKLNINRVEDPVVGPMLGRLIGRKDAVDRVHDYVDADSQPCSPDGLEQQDNPSYVAKNAPVVRLEELMHIPGLLGAAGDEGAWQHIWRQTSPFLAPASRVNINTADREVLEAVFGTAQVPDAILAFRWDPSKGGDPQTGNRFINLAGQVQIVGTDTGIKDLLSPLLTGPLGAVLGVQSDRFTISTVTRLANPPFEFPLEAVVTRSADKGAPAVLSWKEG